MKKKSSSVKRKNLKNSIFSPQIKDKRIKKIYQRFEFLIKQKEFKGYLVAVSGGADSHALAYLSKCYQIKNKDNNFHYVHVDHKLRDKSSKEAGTLKKILRKFTTKQMNQGFAISHCAIGLRRVPGHDQFHALAIR